MRIFKTKVFHEWSRSISLVDNVLKCSALEIQHGLIGNRLGYNLLKKRVALNSRSKAAGARVIIAYGEGELTIFLLGFLKNERDNISAKELVALKNISKFYFELDQERFIETIRFGELIEVL